MNILVLNAGSSSLKFQIIADSTRLCKGEVDRIGGEAIITIEAGANRTKRTAPLRDINQALDYVLKHIASDQGPKEIQSLGDIHAIGHRVVHGGETFKQSALITDEVLQGIEECIDLAPLHNPNAIKGIQAAKGLFGQHVPQVAVFDTSFHSAIPEHAYIYAIPYHLYRRHKIRRYGFHGTSHRYVAQRYESSIKQPANIITFHLGNGCSAAAIKNGSPIDTSMGLTPLEGLVMGTRSGDLDPAAVSFIATKEGLSNHEVESLLNTQSGLLGVSGLTNDMRVLLEERHLNDDRRVCLAIEVFCYRARKYIGAYLAAMGGADAVVFTGGIGENSPDIRAQICQGLEWAGLHIDEEQNKQRIGKEGEITTKDSTLKAYVIPTDEELLIARDTAGVVNHGTIKS